VPILVLNSFLVHMMATVVNAIQDLGVQVEFIPPKYTGLLQPVDVGYNKVFKAKLRTEYNQRIPATTRHDVANWIVAAERKTKYSYFGVFGDGGEFEGDNAMVGNNPN
jgi:hypothetical protein